MTEKRIRYNPSDYEEIEIELGYQKVILDKFFGPLIFANLRVQADPDSCSWVIEREVCVPTGNPSDPWSVHWAEWCRIPGQFDWEFSEEK